MITAIHQEKLSSLKVDRSSGHPKPHKVCLLLAVIDLIKQGKIITNQFLINEDLKIQFNEYFEKLKKGNDDNKIIQPFYHLHSDGIWHFKIKEGKQSDFESLKQKGGTPSQKSLFECIDYAYLDSGLFECFKNEQDRDQAKHLLLQNLEDLSAQYARWMTSIGKSEKTIKNYLGALTGTLSTWVQDAEITQQNLIAIPSYSKIEHISQQLAKYKVFIDTNKRGNSMYSAALNSYKEFLSDICQVEIKEDIENIISNEALTSTEKARWVNTRIGQGEFRESLIQYWKGCALTGYQATEFLVASHIKPWRTANNNERLDVYNGILLLPNLDKAFDRGYISFNESGAIKISEHVESPQTLGISEKLKVNVVAQHQDYLAFHREKVFRL